MHILKVAYNIIIYYYKLGRWWVTCTGVMLLKCSGEGWIFMAGFNIGTRGPPLFRITIPNHVEGFKNHRNQPSNHGIIGIWGGIDSIIRNTYSEYYCKSPYNSHTHFWFYSHLLWTFQEHLSCTYECFTFMARSYSFSVGAYLFGYHKRLTELILIS